MTEQEVFDKVWFGLRSQGFHRSVVAGTAGVCLYRGPNGLKCAAGHLIPDALYTPNIEMMDVTYVPVQKIFVAAGLEEHMALISECQQVHDGGRYPQDVQNGLINLAARHHLTVSY